MCSFRGTVRDERYENVAGKDGDVFRAPGFLCALKLNTNKMSLRRENPDISEVASGIAEKVMAGKTGKMLFYLIAVFGVLLPLT